MANEDTLHTADVAVDMVTDLLAKEEEKALKEILHEQDEEIELTDGELMQALNVYADLAQKYPSQSGSYANFRSLAQEAMDRFAEIGLIVQVDFIAKGLSLDPDEAPVKIEIVGRITEFDREQQYEDVRSGVADRYYNRYSR